MCVICVSNKGVRQPNIQEITNMFVNNSDGAGYMYARNGKVFIHKGFSNLDDYLRDIKGHNFTKDDVVIYHFRIATQARQLTMTHPFAVTDDTNLLKAFDIKCPLGVVHNGIIPMTTNRYESEYSDTALYIRDYLSKYITNKNVIFTDKFKNLVKTETQSKWAFLTGDGQTSIIGDFINVDGLLFSNSSYMSRKVSYYGLKPIFKETKINKVRYLYVKVFDSDNNEYYLDTDLNLGKKKNWSNTLISKYGSTEDIKDEVVDYLYYYNGIEELDGVIEIIWEDFTKENVNFKF